SSIASRVLALGTFSSSGKAWSLTTRLSRMRTASDTDSPMAASASVACVLVSSSTRTCSIVEWAMIRCSVSSIMYLYCDTVKPAHCAHVALYQVQRDHRRLPHKDGNALAPRVWIQEF